MATAYDHNSQLGRKLALVIGNDSYTHPSNRLKNCVSNAHDLSVRLNKIGFEVTTQTDVNGEEFSNALKTLCDTVQNDDLILFYYAGHAFQVNSHNFLIPTDDDHLAYSLDVEASGINIEHHMKRILKDKRLYGAVFILDCSKAYTLNRPRRSQTLLSSKGLHKMTPPSNVLVQFSCDTDETVDDAVRTAIRRQLGGRDNLFTRHLLNHIDRKNLDIRAIFRTVADAVYEESRYRQKPLTMDALASNRPFYFNYVAPPVEKPPVKLTTRQFLTERPLTDEEKNYYEECKEYYRLTKHPLITVPHEIYNLNTKLPSLSFKLGIDENSDKFDLHGFLTRFTQAIGFTMNDLVVKQIQTGSAILEIEINDKFEGENRQLKVKAVVDSITDDLQDELGRMKIFFMFMGPIKSLDKLQKFRSEIKLNPKYNHIYAPKHNYWTGPINDGRDRGGKPYYCPVGWKRWSFYVTDSFDKRFKGWCICYHGTKFEFGLSVLLSGLKPAKIFAHGSGVYATPSVRYAAHPRYAEVKPIQSSSNSKFFPSGQYAQFVLECRVDPNNIKVIGAETLRATGAVIDPNVANDEIEWLINTNNKNILDFNDPNTPIVCTGIMVRITDEHPALLPESDWWFKSHLCDNWKCCRLGIPLQKIQEKRNHAVACNIIYD